MENTIEKINNAIKIIDVYSYISAFYEMIIKHNFGVGIVLTIISLILSVTVHIMNNIEKFKYTYYDKICEINVPIFFRISICLYILIWIIVLFGWLSMVGTVFTTIFLGFILYNMPILFSLNTKFLCYIFQENDKIYIILTLIVSIVLNVILLKLRT